MLTLLIGRAGTGKTSAVMERIRRRVEAGRGRSLLIVPEQYSHEAERELCRRCGDAMSLYAEVFSFTGLARRLSQELGGCAGTMLDKGGRLLCMTMALSEIGPRLRLYGAARRKSELQLMLLRALDELKSACVESRTLLDAASELHDSLGDKLYDLALIREAYDAVLARGYADPSDRLDLLCSQIAGSGLGEDCEVWVDGFIDFTRQESAVLRAMMQQGVPLTVCLTMDGLSGEEEIFELSRIAAHRLIDDAKSLGLAVRIEEPDGSTDRNGALRCFEREMFRYGGGPWQGEAAPIRLIRAENIQSECESAAARVLELVRGGCRWREIAVAVRGFEDYRSQLESCFRRSGIPLFVARRSDLLSKPLPALISLSYEILGGGWELDDLISYMRTGLAGLCAEDCDELADYAFKWQLHGAAWTRPESWRQHPDGYGHDYTDETRERLAHINALRRKLAEPLAAFERQAREAETVRAQAAALAQLLERLGIPAQLERRAERLESGGRQELAREYAQLWELTVSALEQCAAILGDTEMDAESFGSLFLRMLSQYDIGLIPVALDRVSAGDFDRMRRRSIRHLIVLGCSDDRLPLAKESDGMFSEDERERLQELSIALDAEEAELWREFTLIYHTLTLPSESLTLSFPAVGAEGDALRPALVLRRAQTLFSLPVETPERAELSLSAPGPALMLAASSLHGRDARAAAAAEVFSARDPERFARLRAAAGMSRGRLSPAAVEALYGRKIRLSASKIDRFASCQFAYFCQYGLKARPREPESFDAPEIGVFLHEVLENVAKEAVALGGFAHVSDETLLSICDRSVSEFVHRELNDLQEKSARFIHLFRRVCEDARAIVLDMAGELRRSDFEPLEFELDFSKAERLCPLELGAEGESLRLTGIADRVDGWAHDGKLYLRVVDYKTGKKEFRLSDVWYGMSLQMLLYLFTLSENGLLRYGQEVVPAGIAYIPARNVLLPFPSEPSEEELEKSRRDELRRKGLVLDDPSLLEAWEKGAEKQYIPVTFRAKRSSCDSLASAERMGQLAQHIRLTLTEMGKQLHRGSIAADPYYRGQRENACLRCDFLNACFFSDGENGEHCRYLPRLNDAEVWEKLEAERAQGG